MENGLLQGATSMANLCCKKKTLAYHDIFGWFQHTSPFRDEVKPVNQTSMHVGQALGNRCQIAMCGSVVLKNAKLPVCMCVSFFGEGP